MPYRKIVLSDGTVSPVRRVDWRTIAQTVAPSILADMRSSLNGSDGGKWTVFTAKLQRGNTLHVSNGREVLTDDPA